MGAKIDKVKAALTKPFKRKPKVTIVPPVDVAAVKPTAPTPMSLDVSGVIMFVIRDQFEFESAHPVAYAPDQRITACRQRIEAKGVTITPQVEREIVARINNHLKQARG